MGRGRLRGVATVALGVVLGAQMIGCSTDDPRLVQPSVAEQDPAPIPVSPTQALRLLEWVYNNRSVEHYRELLTDDFRFRCSTDSAGAEWRGTPWTREDELIFATHFFLGGGTEPPPTSIRLSLDRNFFVYPDPDYTDWDPLGRWHKSIRTPLSLMITAGGENLAAEGSVVFYLVRGDSAVIPEELRLRGFGPDSARWYIRRWDDETASEGYRVLAAQPSSATTLCQIKALYH